MYFKNLYLKRPGPVEHLIREVAEGWGGRGGWDGGGGSCFIQKVYLTKHYKLVS